MEIKFLNDSSYEALNLQTFLAEDKKLKSLQHPFTIRWGNHIADQDVGLVLNKAAAIKNTLDKENVLLTLRRNKIRAPRRIKPGRKTDFPILGRNYTHKNGTDIRIIDSFEECKKCNCDYFQRYLRLTQEYRIHVMDLKVFFMEEKYHDKYTEEDDNEPTIRTKAFGWNFRATTLTHLSLEAKEEIAQISINAVNSLGLDFGVVSVGKSANSRYYVLDVDATCRWMTASCMVAYLNEFTSTLLKYDTLYSSSPDVTIGADPECLLKDTELDELVYASDFFKLEGPCGLDQRSIEAGKKYFPLLELRPNYSTNPIEVYKSLEEILTGLYEHIHYQNIGIFSGSMPVFGYWLGGHIHFGMKPNSKLIKALNNYLALPMMMVAKPNTFRQRNTTYGVLSNYRLKAHGGFEYCTLSSWLISPEITLAVLCLAKVIVQDYLRLDEEFINTYSDLRAYYLVNTNYFQNQRKRLIQNIRNTPTYEKYQDYLEPLFQNILQSRTWNEDIDIKEQWGLPSSAKRYLLPPRCYVPKTTRKKLGFRLNEKITVRIGNTDYLTEVYPKDDPSSEKTGLISLSSNISCKLDFLPKDDFGLYYDSRNKVYNIGPIFGIFAYSEPHYMGPFALQSYFFAKLIKLARAKGMIAYVFTIWDIDWGNKKVEGYTYDFDTGEWIRKYYPLPQVIYDRGDVLSEYNYGQYALDYIKKLKELNIKLINSLECIATTNNKWLTYTLLDSHYSLKGHQPLTIEFDTDQSLWEFLNREHHVFLKMKDGSRSKGIFSIEEISEDSFAVQFKNPSGYNISLNAGKADLIPLLDQKIKEFDCSRQDYIIQRAINFLSYKGCKFEIRIVMQKNSQGIWHRSCMVSRITGNKGKFLDVWNEQNIKASTVLGEVFQEDYTSVAHRMKEIAKEVVKILDAHHIQSGEIAIDFGLNVDKNIYIIELNSKPDNLLAHIGAFRLRNMACHRILEYGKYLVLKDIHQNLDP